MKIGVYVLTAQAKKTYAVESYNVRKWPGMAIIQDAIQRGGFEYEYCGLATAHEYDIILISITAACDWWPFIAERMKWKYGKYKVVVGGAGVLNVRPFLEFADIFVFGRGENLIVPLIKSIAANEKLKSNSVCYSEDFSIKNKYTIEQGTAYQHSVILEDGTKWQEHVIGCQNKCFFCGYTWQRNNNGILHSENTNKKMFAGKYREVTLLELDVSNPQKWQEQGQLRITALDGFSERLRKYVNKPITRERLRDFLLGLCKIERPHQIKLYNLVGLPTEERKDWKEFIEDLTEVDNMTKKNPKQWSIVLHNSPFRAMPCTPAAHWKMSYANYRGEIARYLKRHEHKGNIFFQGRNFWAVESMATDSLCTVILDAIVWRGVESDANNIKKIAASSKFWRESAAVKQATLEKYFDTKLLFSEFERGKEPTSYLKSYWNQ